jgi:DNA polymerase-3 subunit delta
MAELARAYLITGGDRPKITRALGRLRTHFDDESVELLSARETSGEDAVAACNALGLFGGSRLVVVEDVDGTPNAEGRLTGGWKAADLKAVTEYLAAPSPDTVLALVAAEVKADSALGKAVAKVGNVLAYDVPKRALAKWVAEQFRVHEAQADAEACRALLELVGDNVDELAAEIEKLAIWADGEPISERDVQRLTAARAETSIFALTDAWGRRDQTAALRACEEILDRSPRPRSSELHRLVSQLASHVSRVRECQALAAEGVTAREAAGRLKRAPFYVEKLFGQARNFGVEELRDAIVRLAELDAALKGGSRLAGDLELQRALLDITRPAQPAAAARS